MQHDRNGLATQALHGGLVHRSVGQPVSVSPNLSTSFHTHPSAIGFSANELGADAPDFYTRWGNPTATELENRLALLEGGEAAVTFASGMAAIAGLFLDVLASGDHLIIPDVCYAGVAELARDILPQFGIEVTAVNMANPDAVRHALRDRTRLVHVETPANPTLKLTDIRKVSDIAHAAGALVSVDSTIATPVATRPLEFGADYVVHSLTKYVSGHGDCLAGVVVGRTDEMSRLRRKNLIHLGGALAPFNAWLTLRGLETLVPRMALHESNARQMEAFLAAHPRVKSVFWPGSERHPQHDLARSQMQNYSGLLSFTLHENSADVAEQLAERLRVISYAVSLGKTKSLLFYIPTENLLASSFRLDSLGAEDYRNWAGEGVFRFSVGLENVEDLIQDLDQALG